MKQFQLMQYFSVYLVNIGIHLLNSGFYILAHKLLNLVKQVWKMSLPSNLSFFFSMSLRNSIIQEHEC